MQPVNSQPKYKNMNCIIQRNLGVPLYYRCTYCDSRSRDCLGMQFNLTAGLIIFLLLILPLFPMMELYIHTALLLLIIFALLRLGVLVNKKTDELFVEHFNLDNRNRELTALLDTTTAITSQLDLERILEMLVEHLGGAVECTFAKMILMTDAKKRRFAIKAVYAERDLEWDPGLGYTFELMPNSLLLSLLSKHEPLILDQEQILELYKDKTLVYCLLSNLDNIRSLFLIPACMHGECFGLVVLGECRDQTRSFFTPEKSELAISLVNHASIAIKNAHHLQSLHKVHLETIIGLAEALETRDAYTRGHGDRMMQYAMALSEALELIPEQEDRLRYATILHDIGKIGIPDSILNKPSKLTDEEWLIMRSHSVKGANIISKIQFLERISLTILHHHEHWDGNGYPDGLAGNAIPIESRIVAVLDAYDAMTSDRVYQPAPGRDYAISELRRCSGTQFDPKVVEEFLKIIKAPQILEFALS